MDTFSGQGDQCKKYTDYLFAAKLHAAYAKVDFKVYFRNIQEYTKSVKEVIDSVYFMY